MSAWIIWILIPFGLIAITVSASVARTASGRRKAAFYAVAILVGALSVLGVVYMTGQETWPGGWPLTLAATAGSLLALLLWERRAGRAREPDDRTMPAA